MQETHWKWSRINQWLLWLGLAAATALLVIRHKAHVLEYLPLVILLACPLMHVFGHGSHGGRSAKDGDPPPASDQPENGPPAHRH